MVELLKEHHVAGRLKNLKFTLVEDTGYTTQITKRVRVDVLRFGQGQVVVLNLFPLCRSPGLIRKLAVRRVHDRRFPILLYSSDLEVPFTHSAFEIIGIDASVGPNSLHVRLAVRRTAWIPTLHRGGGRLT